ncbi:small capsid protein [Vespertilionid gammaherpesvirus 1]|uniref:Small capsid protein n=1 Tax=Vespertilionid gammaherpesvirus 1 TaxID=2560830 RepID=A0A120HQI7_9GAMA|nr:small capsid protein [Myotis gammaherpesvirus 8]AMA67422.1 small capsid protein [Vespertilionid gammaherpesvirus 1]
MGLEEELLEASKEKERKTTYGTFPMLKLPIIQSKLEQIDASGETAAKLAKIDIKDADEEVLERHRQLFLCYLIASSIYEKSSSEKLGIRRNIHLGTLEERKINKKRMEIEKESLFGSVSTDDSFSITNGNESKKSHKNKK